jgi:hypothetical protein
MRSNRDCYWWMQYLACLYPRVLTVVTEPYVPCAGTPVNRDAS